MFKNIIRKDKADTVALEYKPKQFRLGVSDFALEYLGGKNSESGKDFRMADVMRIQTGIRELELSALEDQLESKALEKLKEIQENAYKEAFQLGLDEGRKKAFEENSQRISDKLYEMSNLLERVKLLKKELTVFNEAHIVKLVYYLASRLAMTEVEKNPNIVINVMKQAIELADEDEEVVVRVAPEQVNFLDELKKETKRELEFLKNVRFEPGTDIEPGGCVIETNYGEIDARIEERVNKLWESLQETIPIVKDKVG